MNWINIKDKLPEDEQHVLAIVEKLSGGFYIPFTCKFQDGAFFCEGYDSFSGKGVTHWMPLPEPPKP